MDEESDIISDIPISEPNIISLDPEKSYQNSTEEEGDDEEDEEEGNSTSAFVNPETEQSDACFCKFKVIHGDDQESIKGEEDLEPSPSEVLYDELVHHTLYSKDRESTDSRLTPSSVTTNIKRNILPFAIKWSLGFTLDTRILNLSHLGRKEIYIATAHKGILFDYSQNKMRFIHGHVRYVNAASVDKTGKWLVTGGYGEGSLIVVSNTHEARPLLVIENPKGDHGALIVGMAPNAKYFISVHNKQKPLVKIWCWTFGTEKPDDIFPFERFVGYPKKIVFHPNNQDHIMIAFEKQLLLIRWNHEKRRFENPIFPITTKVKGITDCALSLNCHECFVSTVSGHIAIFGSAYYTEQFHEHPLTNQKIYVKKIKVSKCSLTNLVACDSLLACTDQSGQVRFFDTTIRLLFWIEKELPPVNYMSFNLSRPNYIFDDVRFSDLCKTPFAVECTNSETVCYEEIEDDRSNEIELIIKSKTPSDYSLEHPPFICRPFVAGCRNGTVYYIDVTNNIYNQYFYDIQSPVVSMSCSSERSHLYVAYENGQLSLYDYERIILLIANMDLVAKSPDFEFARNTDIKVSAFDYHIALARTNGELLFLGQSLKVLPNQKYQFSNRSIKKLIFSQNCLFLAYHDVSNTMYVLKFSKKVWNLMIKFRGHSDEITDCLFLYFDDPKLYSISKDKYLVEYNFYDAKNPLKKRGKIEETAEPLSFMLYPTPPNSEKYFLVANSEYKYKLIHEETFNCRSVSLGPCLGCYEMGPVNKIMLLPECHGKYFLFANYNHIGLQKNRPDGNPYKHCGVLANPMLGNIAVSRKGKNAFTHSPSEGGILVWAINTDSVEALHYLGGPYLDPYFCLLEGGARGWFFKEMEDLFCYMQILHQGDPYARQKFTDKISITDLPDIVRACGYYPSNYEIDLMLDDIQYRDYEKTKKLRRTISFVELVKLIINHRPAHGITAENLKQKFNCLFTEQPVDPDAFKEVLCTTGEAFNSASLEKCLEILLNKGTIVNESEETTNLKPVTFEYFSDTILGIVQGKQYEETLEKELEKEEQDIIEELGYSFS